MSVIDAFQRASVEDLRQDVIERLKEAYADNRISVDTLERRLTEATSAQDKETLLALVADIPAPKGEPKTEARPQEGEPDRTWRINDRVPRDNESLFAFLSGSERTGRWQPARQIHAYSILGGVKLDFREAEFPRDGVDVDTGCFLGGLDIIVPEGINIDLAGFPILGGFENKAGQGDHGAPTVRVRGFAILGGVEIKRREVKRRRRGRR